VADGGPAERGQAEAPAARPQQRLRLSILWGFIWGGLIVYGSLLPFDFHPLSWQEAQHRFALTPLLDLGVEQRADLIANFVLYLPLGFLLAASWPLRRVGAVGVSIVLMSSSAVAVAVEFVQLWFPARTVSLNDLQAEILGGLAGVVFYALAGQRLGRWVAAIQSRSSGLWPALLALYAMAYVAICLFPFDFLLSLGELRWKLSQNENLWIPAAPDVGVTRVLLALLVDAGAAVPLGFAIARAAGGRRSPWRFLLRALPVAFGLELAQFLLASGVAHVAAALMRLSGLCFGAWLSGSSPGRIGRRLHYWRHPRRVALGLGAVYLWLALLATFDNKGAWVGYAGVVDRLPALNWLPFYYHYYTSEPVALANLLATIGLYAPIGVLLSLTRLQRMALRQARIGWVTASLLGLGAGLAVEALKLGHADGHPDPTSLLVAPVAAWLGYRASALALRWFMLQTRRADGIAAASGQGRLWLCLTLLPTIATALLLVRHAEALNPDPVGKLLVVGQLPSPALVASEPFPDFRYQRPRLPAPEPGDMALLDRNWLAERRAAAGRGSLDDTILMARLEPGAWGLTDLLQKLLALKPTFRGHEQAKPLALAYDWLYSQWTEAELQQLRTHLLEACSYTAENLRQELLSPYNVYLYNSPLQALVACSITLYRDHPTGTALLNFTRHMLDLRVKPVWQQVMQDGGWHEGGEYVGLGIGQAVYQIPAMWRRATGADWFSELPGIRGFADFLIYRTQPDGRQLRMGDGNHHDKPAPDQWALALEFDHAAAYSLGGCPGPGRPSSWPWGPLTGNRLCDRDAASRLPLMRLFRGTGLLVSRTGWNDSATYATFKAGDNYWSHSHLDQGAFTIYRGGPLALDSGVYGREYGRDHHMNYFYQTVAHNLVTVTDPADRVPMPIEGGSPRPIANDGGQRRVGSGWGLGPAPVDVAGWTAEREQFHTARLLSVHDAAGLTVAVADLTPAYTNRYSGLGRFGERTRRVERYWRTFVHDRLDDVILIHDRLRIANGQFATRWLLHSEGQPERLQEGFRVRIAPGTGPGRQGGSLTARILAPTNPVFEFIGGPGREFWVDGRNFDDAGGVQKFLSGRDMVAGRWRTEIAAAPGRDVEFLVALLPGDPGSVPSVRLTALGEGDRTGCLVEGRYRRSRWWFSPDQPLPNLEVAEGQGAFQRVELNRP
jgi:VanZ family protein